MQRQVDAEEEADSEQKRIQRSLLLRDSLVRGEVGAWDMVAFNAAWISVSFVVSCLTRFTASRQGTSLAAPAMQTRSPSLLEKKDSKARFRLGCWPRWPTSSELTAQLQCNVRGDKLSTSIRYIIQSIRLSICNEGRMMHLS
jgi:hypothetical protein